MNKTITGIYMLSAILALAACGGNKERISGTQEEEATKVVVTEASYADVPQRETYASSVQAYAVNNIVPQSGGRIKKINVEIGDYVRAGQVLAEMDKASLEQAKLKLVNDSTELARLKELYLNGGVSQADYEAVELAYNVSRTSYDNLLENTILRSPINGVVTARNYDAGDMYGAGEAIYVVQQILPVKLLVGVSEKDYTRVNKGDKVSISVDAIPGRTFEGKVGRIYPTIDESTHTFTVEVVVGNSDKALRPGMYARVEVTFGINRSIVIPDSAIVKQQGSGQKAVYLYGNDGRAVYTIVKLGRHIGNTYEVLDGLSEGDKVITKGNAGLKSGSKITL